MDEHEPVGRRLERGREDGARLPIALDEVLGAVRAHPADPQVHLVRLASGGQRFGREGPARCAAR